MVLTFGSREEHIATLRRAKAAGVNSVWSGDIARNQYLQENLQLAEAEKILKLEPYTMHQESGWKFEWLNHPEVP